MDDSQQPDSQQPDSQRPVKNVAVLGATGSIGTATADVINHLQRVDPDHQWRMWAASGHRNLAALTQIAEDASLRPERLVLSDPSVAGQFRPSDRLGPIKISTGPEALVEAAQHPAIDVVVAAIVGRAGLESTLAAVESGKRVALANKETLVLAGPLVRQRLQQSDAELLPVDSEHSAIFQCMRSCGSIPKRLILTASGGPFRTWSKSEMDQATPKSALAHPTWDMGPKITIDSATMMNKSLEVIEARWLFDVPAEKIEVVVHPQSIVHSMVEFEDGSVIAQLSPPDMRLPIQFAMTYPRRLPCGAPPLDRAQTWDLTLEPVDRERFPALDLGFEVARVGGTAGAVVNAANEQAVGLFLDGQIRFTDIVPRCRQVLENHTHEAQPPLDRLLDLDRWARAETLRSCGLKA
ncbi:MAG: 1-deoxy-D-xylulose-5-phosphate reductoisomerase [Pirellulaceae bacterium]|nr:1-deoxy-D-xylulose-5-phosphate reductoisomerase [Pirellulaceae bacterium]